MPYHLVWFFLKIEGDEKQRVLLGENLKLKLNTHHNKIHKGTWGFGKVSMM